MMAPLAGPLGGIVLNGLSGPVRVLDIAAGHGLFGIEIAKQHDSAEIVALDWAPVLEVAKANARAAGVIDRFTTIPGSAFDVDYVGPYDIVLLTNFLHHFDPALAFVFCEKCMWH
jgi:2-polyprenyl-3-methyl-5-hydroxy-6-metoxy-1,4-benzoquinol methylase